MDSTSCGFWAFFLAFLACFAPVYLKSDLPNLNDIRQYRSIDARQMARDLVREYNSPSGIRSETVVKWLKFLNFDDAETMVTRLQPDRFIHHPDIRDYHEMEWQVDTRSPVSASHPAVLYELTLPIDGETRLIVSSSGSLCCVVADKRMSIQNF
jgi:hypothetical protein